MYLDGEMHAVTQMHALQWACNTPSAAHKTLDCKVRDIVALDQADPPKLWQQSELDNTSIREAQTASKVDISYASAMVDEGSNRAVRNVIAVPEMQVVEIFPKLGY